MPAQTSKTPEFALRLEGVALGYGDFTVLRDISMDVRAGQAAVAFADRGAYRADDHRCSHLVYSFGFAGHPPVKRGVRFSANAA